MIRVHIRRGILGTAHVERSEVEWRGQSACDLLLEFAPSEWRGLAIGCAMSGRKLTDEEMSLCLPDNVDVIFCPDPAGGFVTSAFSYAVGYAVRYYTGTTNALDSYVAKWLGLAPRAKAPNVPLERGDAESPTYDFGGTSTVYGQGQSIPIVFGEHNIGGQVISAQVVANSQSTPGSEIGRWILALSEGPIDSIGGEKGGVVGEFNALGGFPGGGANGFIPENIAVNGNKYDRTNPLPGLRAWGRMGTIDQSPLPGPFNGVRITEVVGESLTAFAQSAVHTIADTGDITSVSVILTAPSGIYQQNTATGALTPAPVDFSLEWRPVGGGTWSRLASPFTLERFGDLVVSLGAYSQTYEYTVLPGGTPVRGPIEIRIIRSFSALGTNVVNQLVWRQVVWSTPHELAYPRVALLALEVQAGETVSGGQPDFRARIRGVKVRSWEPTVGFSGYSWDVPGGPWSFHAYPIGRNPAWVMVEYLLADWGLGRFVQQTQLDLDAFVRWAIYCDQQPGPIGNKWSEARYRCDLVHDRSTPAWEVVQQIADTGGATALQIGDKITVVYRYRDAHAAATVSVPAKARSQLFSAPILQDFSASWLPIHERPTVIEYQFLDEQKDYAQDTLPVQDPDSNIDDPAAFDQDRYTKVVQQVYGVTRRSQLFRQGWLDHRRGRLTRKGCQFVVPFFALAAQVGDVVGVQTDVLLPYSFEAFGMTIATGGVGVTTIAVDIALVLSPGQTYEILTRTPAGDVDSAIVTSGAGTYAAGAPLTLATPVDCEPGAPCAIGIQNAVVEDYEIVSLTLAADAQRQVHGVLWAPAAYDEPTPAQFDDGASGDGLQQSTYLEAPYFVAPADITLTASPHTPGTWVLTFDRPPDRHASRARAYMRPVGSPTWLVLGETLTDTVELRGLEVWHEFEAAVVLENRAGVFGIPVEAQIATLEVQEFPPTSPPDVHDAVVQSQSGDVVVTWTPLAIRDLDHYEIRRGGWVDTAEVVGRSAVPRWVDRVPRVHLGDQYWILARSTSGLYSMRPDLADDPEALGAFWSPPGAPTLRITAQEVQASPVGTLVDLVHGADPLYPIVTGFTHVGIKFSGTYTSAEYQITDGDGVAIEPLAYWVVRPELRARDEETLADWTWTFGSGEARWRTISFRPPSAGRPGIGRKTIGELFPTAVTIDWVEREGILCSGLRAGEPGERFFAELESRFYVGGFWSSWTQHRDGFRKAERIQARVTLAREGLSIRVWLTHFNITAHV